MNLSKSLNTDLRRVFGALMLAVAILTAGFWLGLGILIGHEAEALQLAAFAVVPAVLELMMLRRPMKRSA